MDNENGTCKGSHLAAHTASGESEAVEVAAVVVSWAAARAAIKQERRMGLNFISRRIGRTKKEG